MNSLGIIPARYESTRFPGKPLIMIEGRSMIRRVFEQASLCRELSRVVVATDHRGIFDHVLEFGGEAVLTVSTHKSGTERCAEALEIIMAAGSEAFDVVVNIQGDEPFISPGQISEVIHALGDPGTSIASLVRRIRTAADIVDPNVVKVVFDTRHHVLYFSRSAIPFERQRPDHPSAGITPVFEHVGIYGFRAAILPELVRLPESSLERAESLEQLRWLQNGYHIVVAETDYESISIDSPADLLKITNRKA